MLFDQSYAAPTRSILHNTHVTGPSSPESDREKTLTSAEHVQLYIHIADNGEPAPARSTSVVSDAPNVCISRRSARRPADICVVPCTHQVDAIVSACLATLARSVAALTLGGASETFVAPFVDVKVVVTLVLTLFAAAVVHALVAYVHVESGNAKYIRS